MKGDPPHGDLERSPAPFFWFEINGRENRVGHTKWRESKNDGPCQKELQQTWHSGAGKNGARLRV